MRMYFILATLLLALLAACGGGAPTAADPLAAAKGYYDAIFAANVPFEGYVCSSGAAEAQQTVKVFKELGALVGGTFDTSGLTYAVQNQTADTAEVAISGMLKVTADGNTSEEPFDTITKLKQENGVWRVCD